MTTRCSEQGEDTQHSSYPLHSLFIVFSRLPLQPGVKHSLFFRICHHHCWYILAIKYIFFEFFHTYSKEKVFESWANVRDYIFQFFLDVISIAITFLHLIFQINCSAHCWEYAGTAMMPGLPVPHPQVLPQGVATARRTNLPPDGLLCNYRYYWTILIYASMPFVNGLDSWLYSRSSLLRGLEYNHGTSLLRYTPPHHTWSLEATRSVPLTLKIIVIDKLRSASGIFSLWP